LTFDVEIPAPAPAGQQSARPPVPPERAAAPLPVAPTPPFPPSATSALGADAITLAVYDDHVIARSGLPALLVEEGIRVVDAAPVDPRIVERGIDPTPDVAVVAGGHEGAKLARGLAEQHGIAVLRLMATGAEVADMLAVLGSGAAGAVCRRCSADRVRRAIDTVARGGMFFDCPHNAPTGPALAPVLSPRERRVATELARGSGTEEIAEALYLSPHTVRTHIRNIQRKLGARTRAHAIAVAITNRELEPPGPQS
jgi:DNA-binding NarL/FixJ family response regulator